MIYRCFQFICIRVSPVLVEHSEKIAATRIRIVFDISPVKYIRIGFGSNFVPNRTRRTLKICHKKKKTMQIHTKKKRLNIYARVLC